MIKGIINFFGRCSWVFIFWESGVRGVRSVEESMMDDEEVGGIFPTR